MASEERDLFSDRIQGTRRGGYPIPLSPNCTAGFLGRTERGPVDEAFPVESLAEYLRFFGGHLSDGGVSHAVQDYFLHGGKRAVIVRVANRATRARLDLPGEDGTLRLQARYPGRHEVLRASIDYERVEDEPTQFNLVVQRIRSQASPFIEDQELYPLVSITPTATRYLGKVLQNSRLIALQGPAPPSRPFATPPERPGSPVRYVPLTFPGDDGDELSDYDIVGSNQHGTGLFAFDRGPRIDLLSIPLPPERELGTTALVAAARYCEVRRALLIWDPPLDWQSADSALLGSRRLDIGNGSVLTYFPRIRPRGAGARYLGGLPAGGAIAGMLAGRDRRGYFGGDEDSDYSLRAALTPVLELNALQAQRLARAGINVFMHAGAGATRLIGRVTLGSGGIVGGIDASLSSRRLLNFILNSVEDALADALPDLDTPAGIERLERQLRRFFRDLYQHGALKGGSPEQSFFLRVSQAAPGHVPELFFGIALAAPACFEEYVLMPAGEPGRRLRRVRRLEADRFFN